MEIVLLQRKSINDINGIKDSPKEGLQGLLNSGNKKRILDGESTTRNWTNEQKQEILKSKKPQYNGKSIIGHHTYNAMNYPHISNRGELIYPVTGREHLKGLHGGSYSKNAPGRPVNPDYLEEF
ncbi:hypothetical protein ACIQT5_17000 [Bacillus safensis]|uniref:hypothetical protein n=1 Tax=Bacillus safensis TaxID=561879 RepID=UPI00382FF9AC